MVERAGLANLLQERQLIRATRQEFEGGEAKPLPPIRFAGLIVEGGIIGYDANTVTGGPAPTSGGRRRHQVPPATR